MIKSKKKPLVSIIIATFNSAETIQDTLSSIKKQVYKNYEVIIIDKESNDETISIINKNKLNSKIFVGKDKGIYDAINKGIRQSKGKIISILHSNDFYFNNKVLSNVVETFIKQKVDIVYGNLIYVKKYNKNRIVRHWISSSFKNGFFYRGWSPPHPSFFCYKNIYNKHGLYKQFLGNPADIELMFRFLQQKKLSFHYLNKTLVVMRYGGSSNKNLYSILNQNLEILKFLKINKKISLILIFLFCKFFNRIKQIL